MLAVVAENVVYSRKVKAIVVKIMAMSI